MNNDRKTELLVGLFLLIGLLLLGGLILQFGRVNEAFKDTFSLQVAFPNANGIKTGSPVMLGGSKIGRVKQTPELNDTFDGVVITLEIYGDVKIPADAQIAVGSAGLMGDALIEITPSGKPTTEFIAHDFPEVIQGKKGTGLGELQDTAQQVGKKVDVVLDDVRDALKPLRDSLKKLNETAMSEETLGDFKESIEHLNNTMARLDDHVLGEENAKALGASLKNLGEATESFKKAAKTAEGTIEKLDTSLEKLDPALEKLDSVMTNADEALIAIKGGAESFSTTMNYLRDGEGLLGALMEDEELKADFKDLVYNLKRNGVLFYRDSAEKEDDSGSNSPSSGANDRSGSSVFGPADRKPLFSR